MPRTKLLILIFSLILIKAISAYELTVNPISIDKEYIIGTTPLSNVTIEFTSQEDNATFDLTLTKSGNMANLIILSTNILHFVNRSTTILEIGFNIPDSTTPNPYIGTINFEGGSIPVYINVKKDVSIRDCRIIIPFSEYIYSISRNTKPYKEDFSFRVSSKCIEGMDVTDIKLSGVILTETGYSPIRVVGGLPKGFFEGGDLLSLTTEFDVTNLEKGTYTSYIIISGTDKLTDDSITSTMKFKITVVGVAGPLGNVEFIEPPTWESIPQELVLNKSYMIIARNVNPNLEIVVEPNSFIYGEMVETQDDSWRYSFHPIIIGNTIIRVYAVYKGGIIGNVQEREVRITSVLPEVAGTNLTFQFFPDISNLVGGSDLTVLIKDAKNQNIISNFELFLDGKKQEQNTFVVESGRNYVLQATSPGYNSIEYQFTITPQTVSISFSKNPVLVNTTVEITTNPEDAKVFLNDIEVNKNYTSEAGTFTFIAFKEGYNNGTSTLTVEPEITITHATPEEEIGLNKQITLGLNKEIDYIIYYKKDKNTLPVEFFKGKGNTIIFTPDKKGTYYAEIEGKTIWDKEFKSFLPPLKLKELWKWLVGIVVVLLIIYLAFIRKGRGRKIGIGTPSSMEEEALIPIE